MAGCQSEAEGSSLMSAKKKEYGYVEDRLYSVRHLWEVI
jgi:hypothetical protein